MAIQWRVVHPPSRGLHSHSLESCEAFQPSVVQSFSGELYSHPVDGSAAIPSRVVPPFSGGLYCHSVEGCAAIPWPFSAAQRKIPALQSPRSMSLPEVRIVKILNILNIPNTKPCPIGSRLQVRTVRGGGGG